ncbi:hypothetical protein [Nocardia caishijiensis]|uniref:hypothetical protein n=1 Tax=Nocardia caishijiensis TaxID=184756 RepID=UPI001428D139|nr:hypothetical protein [Nocardia caishijiensis]
MCEYLPVRFVDSIRERGFVDEGCVRRYRGAHDLVDSACGVEFDGVETVVGGAILPVARWCPPIDQMRLSRVVEHHALETDLGARRCQFPPVLVIEEWLGIRVGGQDESARYVTIEDADPVSHRSRARRPECLGGGGVAQLTAKLAFLGVRVQVAGELSLDVGTEFCQSLVPLIACQAFPDDAHAVIRVGRYRGQLRRWARQLGIDVDDDRVTESSRAWNRWRRTGYRCRDLGDSAGGPTLCGFGRFGPRQEIGQRRGRTRPVVIDRGRLRRGSRSSRTFRFSVARGG